MKGVYVEYDLIHVRWYDPDGWECIEAVPFFGSIENSDRLSYLLSIGGEIIPD